MSERDYARVREALARAESVLVISGAGISAESGIPTFRSEGGWYRGRASEQLATLAHFREDPVGVWEWYGLRRAQAARAAPNRAHAAVAEWERAGKRVFVITQNVDDLHERAGSSAVVHIHGSLWQLKCLDGGGPIVEDRRVPLPELPPPCPCGRGGIARPNVVWFDEELPAEEVARVNAFFRAGRVDIAFVVGTEASFDYIRGYAREARALGALLVEVNPDETLLTPFADVRLAGKAGDVLAALSG